MALPGIVKDAAIYGSADIIGKLVAFVTFPIIAAALSPEDFGVLELGMTIVGLFGIVIGCGVSNSVQRFYWDNDMPVVDRSIIISSGFSIQIFLGLLFIIISGSLAFLLKHFAPNSGIPLARSTIFALILLTPASQWLQFIQDTTRLLFLPWRFLSLSVFIKTLVAALSVVSVVLLHKGVDGYITVQTLGIICAIPVGILMIKNHLTLNIQKEWCKDLFKFGYPFIFVMIAYWLFGSMDRWMLASMSSINETGIYSISYRFSSIVLFVSSAFGLAWSPHSMKIIMNNRSIYPKVCGIALICLVFLMLIVGGSLALFSGEIIGTIMPNTYQDATLPLSILCFGIIIQSTTQITAVGISLSKKTQIFAQLAWATAFINLVGNWFLIPHYGATGAAIATTLSYCVLTIAYGLFTQKLDPIKIYWKPMIWLIFLGCILASVSFYYNALDWGWLTVKKLIFAVLMLILGIVALPIKDIKTIANQIKRK